MKESRSVLISGANGGIGQALCAAFRRDGWHVIATDLQAAPQSPSDAYVAADLSRFGAEAAYREDCIARMRAALPQ